MQETDKKRSSNSSLDQQSQNLKYIGLIINGIVHSFNNSIGLVRGYADLSLRATEGDSRLHGYAENIVVNIDSLKELVDKMRIFSEEAKENFQSISLEPVVGEAVNLISETLKLSGKIQSDCDSACGAVLADVDQIRQVVVNLCSNACNAVKDNNGSIKVSLKEIDGQASSDEAPQNLSNEKYAKLTVSDTGCGMEEDVMERIFEPFFTTNKENENAGLGLAVVKGIVKGHGGEIEVKSKPGEGTTFDIYLPLGDKK